MAPPWQTRQLPSTLSLARRSPPPARPPRPSARSGPGSRFGADASLAFNEGVTLFLEGDLDLRALDQSLADLVGRHEAIRSTVSGDGLTLLIGPDNAPSLKAIDLADLDQAEREKRWWDLCTKEVETPFDLDQGPLYRVHLARLSPFEHRICFTAHHIVCDGFSTGVLIHEWAQLYSARLKGKAPELAPADSFAAYSRRMLSEQPGTKEHEAFWVEQFKGETPILQLPSDRPRPPVKTYAALREDVALPKELITKLKAAGAKHRASLFNTLLGGFVALVSRLSNQDDIVVGIPSAGQSAAGLSTLVGHCVNTLPVRARFDADQPFAALLDTVRKAMLDALEHQEYTFGQLLKVLPLPRDPSRLPLVSVCFNLDKGLGAGAMPFEGLKPRLFTNPRRYETFDLFVNASELEGQVSLEVQYNTDLFDTRTVQRWLAGYRQLLEAVAADPQASVARLPMVTEAEKAELLSFTESKLEVPQGCVHELLEAQAAKSGGKVAVELGAEQLTYAQLEAKANRIARRLRALGVGQGALVGLAVERGPDMLAGLFGILKSGAGYVPLDPGYPSERLAFMVTDAQMPVLRHPEAPAGRAEPAGAEARCWWTTRSCEKESAAPLAKDDEVGRSRVGLLRHLHLGLDRQAEGRAGAAPRGGQPARQRDARARHDRRRRGDRGHHPVVRHRGVGDHSPRHRGREDRARQPRHGGRRRAAARAVARLQGHLRRRHARHLAAAARRGVARAARG